MDILRFITAGNVDDGKSTLIGRLLYDTGNLKSDILQSVHMDNGHGAEINLAHITDGLRSERAQGITIDVAYKYFTTRHRKYIITDAPGHLQYTRNMVTGASGVDLIIILIDARNGITDQTRRHSMAASFLGIRQVIVAVNKMDAVGYDEKVFEHIKAEYSEIVAQLNLKSVTYIPFSALLGDNVSHRSSEMDWYSGATLLEFLESCDPVTAKQDKVRCSVQTIIQNKNEVLYAGKLCSGTIKVGDSITIWPQRTNGVINKIIHGFEDTEEAVAGQNISIGISGTTAGRGDLLSLANDEVNCTQQLNATICWLDAAKQLQPGKPYIMRINANETFCEIAEIICKIDVSTFHENTRDTTIAVNDFAKVVIKTINPVAYDKFSEIPANGRGIIIDPDSNYTCGAFIAE